MHDRRRRTWLLRLGVVALAGCLALATFGWHHDHGSDRGRLSGTPGRGLPGTTFRVASFNMLGAVHTDTGQRPGWASSYKRTAWAAQLMAENGLQVIGLQEFEAVQYDRFKQVTGSTYGLYPGVSLGRRATVQNSIAWRRDTWRLVEAHTIRVPYFNGTRLRMPYVLLQNLATGENVWFYNVAQPRRHPRLRLEVAPRGLQDRGRPGGAAAGGRPLDRRRRDRRQERTAEVLLLRRGPLGPALRERRLVEQRRVHPAGRSARHRLGDGHLRRPVRPLPVLPRRLVAQDHRPPDRDGRRDHRPTDAADRLPRRRRRSAGPPVARRPGGRLDRRGRPGPDDDRRRLHPQRPHRGRADVAGRQRRGHAHRRPSTRPEAATGSSGSRHPPRPWAPRPATTSRAPSTSCTTTATGPASWPAAATSASSAAPGATAVSTAIGVNNGRDKLTHLATYTSDGPVVRSAADRAGRRPLDPVVRPPRPAGCHRRALRLRQPAVRRRGQPSCPARSAASSSRSPTTRPWPDTPSSSSPRDSGGQGRQSADPTLLRDYRVPFLVTGPGVPAGSDLYALNPQLSKPGRVRVGYDGAQPVRNAFVANLVTKALGMPPVTGSTLDSDQSFTAFAPSP